jgi:hypothetical protein
VLLRKVGTRLLTQLISNIYETGAWPKDLIELIMTALKKKTKTAKCRDHRILSLIAHTTKIVVRIIRRRIESKIEDVLGEICLDLEGEKELGMQL